MDSEASFFPSSPPAPPSPSRGAAAALAPRPSPATDGANYPLLQRKTGSSPLNPPGSRALKHPPSPPLPKFLVCQSPSHYTTPPMIFHHDRFRPIHSRTVKDPKVIVAHDDAVDKLMPGLGAEDLAGVDGEPCAGVIDAGASGGVFADGEDVPPGDGGCALWGWVQQNEVWTEVKPVAGVCHRQIYFVTHHVWVWPVLLVVELFVGRGRADSIG